MPRISECLQCAFPGCRVLAMHSHHIVYEPQPIVKKLCEEHHHQITIINGQQARRIRHTLSTKHRWWIWYGFIEGRLKPRRTAKAMEYIEEMKALPKPILRPSVLQKQKSKKKRVVANKRKAKRPRRRKARQKRGGKTEDRHHRQRRHRGWRSWETDMAVMYGGYYDESMDDVSFAVLDSAHFTARS